jgi:hypothetical protein
VPSPAADRWYCVEQMLDIGDPVSDSDAAEANGEFRSYIDGVLVAQIPDLHIRTSPGFIGPSEIFLHLYFHELSHNNAGQMFDNVVVSTKRVGCGTDTPDVKSPVLTPAALAGNVTSPVTLSVSSDKACVAKSGSEPRPYGYDVAQTRFSSTGGLSHSTSLMLGGGKAKAYLQCADPAGNISNMAVVNFSVSGPSRDIQLFKDGSLSRAPRKPSEHRPAY